MLALLAVVGGVLFGLAPRIDNLGATLCDELHGVRDELRGEIHEVRTEPSGEIAGQTARLDTMNLRLDEQVKETAGLRVEVGQILERLTRVESAT
jgi:Sec-independent protein translocase protein TatA